MDREKRLEKQFQEYQELAKQKQDIDVAGLMMNALQRQETNLISSRQKHWAYLVSLALPPLGLIFAAKFYLSGKDDGRQAAIICVVLTAASLLLVWLFGKILFSGSNIDLNQLQQIKPQDIQELYQ